MNRILNASFDKRISKWTINDLTEVQIDLIRDCVDTIRRNYIMTLSKTVENV